MPHPLEHLTRATPGIIEVWVSDLIADSNDEQSGRLATGNLQTIGALSEQELNQYRKPVAHLTGYVEGLFEGYVSGNYPNTSLVYLKNQGDNVLALFDCRHFLK